MLANLKKRYEATTHSAHVTNKMISNPNSVPSTEVQLLQTGTLHSINLPGARNPHEVERLQEYVQNTAFGTRNLGKCRNQDIVKFLRNYYCMSEKVVGGVFDGLSQQEVQFLREQGWVEERQWLDEELNVEEMRFLHEQSLSADKSAFPVLTVAAAVCKKVGVIGDGRPSRQGKKPSVSSPSSTRVATPLTSRSSSSVAWSAETPPPWNAPASPSLLAKLVMTSMPYVESNVSPTFQGGPTRQHRRKFHRGDDM